MQTYDETYTTDSIGETDLARVDRHPTQSHATPTRWSQADELHFIRTLGSWRAPGRAVSVEERVSLLNGYLAGLSRRTLLWHDGDIAELREAVAAELSRPATRSEQAA